MKSGAESGYFANIFGDTLSADEVERSPLLLALRDSAIGSRADIEIDRWMRDPSQASIEVRDALDSKERRQHTTVATRRGPMTLSEYGEALTISDDADLVADLQSDLVSDSGFLALWRRKAFFELQSEIGGRTRAFARLTAYPHFGRLLDLSDSVRRGLDVSEQKQLLIRGLNFLVAGYHRAGQLIVPEIGSLIARDPGSYRPPSPSMVHREVSADQITIENEDSDPLRSLVDTDDIRVRLIVKRSERPSAEILLTPRLHHAICDSADFKAPVGSEIPEMNELRIFYGELSETSDLSELQIVDPERGAIRTISLPLTA